MNTNLFSPKLSTWFKGLLGLVLVVILAAALSVFLNLQTARTETIPSTPERVHLSQENTPTPPESTIKGSPADWIIHKNDEVLVKKVEKAIERTLSSPAPGGYYSIPHETSLLGLRITDEEIVIDLSKEILASGTGVELEDALHLIATSVGNLNLSQLNGKKYTFLIEGKPLQEYRQL